MDRKDVAPFEPDRALRDRLRKECTADDGTVVGDVRWWPPANCLYIWTLLPNGKDWMPRVSLLDSKGWPRQINLKDLEEQRAMLHEARHVTNSHWWQQVQDDNAEAEANALRAAKAEVELAREIAQEKKRRGYCMHGVRGDVDCPTCVEGKAWADGGKKKRVQVQESRKARVTKQRGIVTTDRRRAI